MMAKSFRNIIFFILFINIIAGISFAAENDMIELVRLDNNIIRLLNENSAIIIDENGNNISITNPFIFLMKNDEDMCTKKISAKLNPIIRKIYNSKISSINNAAIINENNDGTYSVLIEPLRLFKGTNIVFLGGINANGISVKTSELVRITNKKSYNNSGCNSGISFIMLMIFLKFKRM